MKKDEPFEVTTNDASVMIVDGVPVPQPNNPKHPDFEKEKKEAIADAPQVKEVGHLEVEHKEVDEHADGS